MALKRNIEEFDYFIDDTGEVREIDETTRARPVEILGCLDRSASNYNPRATTHVQQMCEYNSTTGVNPDIADAIEKLMDVGELQHIGDEPIVKITGGGGTTSGSDVDPTPIDDDFIDETLTLPAVTNTYKVRIIGDVSSNDIIKYSMETISEFVKDGMDVVRTHTQDPLLKSAIIPWIELQRVGITTSTHSVRYEILDAGSIVPTIVEDDFKKTLDPGLTTIKVIVNKLTTVPIPGKPTLSVSNDSLQYNNAADTGMSIQYYTNNTDTVIYTLGKVQRTLGANGVIRLTSADFSNGTGSYTLYLQPQSAARGSGDVKRVVINVISKDYSDGPDITNISYPANIKGSSFSEYNVNFRIGWQSINTNYVEVYVGKYDKEYALAKVEPSGTLTLNVADVLRKSKRSLTQSTNKTSFDLIIIPFNTETDTVVSGNHEKISIVFDKGDLRLYRNQVISDLKKSFTTGLNSEILHTETSKFLTHYVHFGDGNNQLISNWGIDKETFSDYTTNPDTNELRKTKEVKSLVLKLYEPLTDTFQPNQQLWVSKIQSIPVIDQVVLEDEAVHMCTPLLPNFDIDLGDDVGYQILDDLMASGSVSSTDLVNEYIGSNEFSLAKLNIKYTDDTDYLWINFVKFSSAAERVDNLFYKIKTIEFHNEKLSELAIVPQTISVTNEIKREREKANNIIRSFDAFEKQLYKTDDPLSYPGAGQTAVSASDSPDTIDWYTGIKGSADDFDYDNKNALINNLPQHVKDEEEGQDFVLFFNMIGQHFDVLSSYITGLEESKDLSHNSDTGIANDLIYHMLESLGWDADMGVKSQYLWEYAFGTSKEGEEVSSLSGKRRQQEVWRRLLNNLPYLFKHKGTKRALSAAMACYGVPTSMLTIMEFGGPRDSDDDGITKVTFDDRTSALSFDGSSSILVPYHTYITTGEYPQCVELRVQTDTPGNYTLIETEGWKLEVLSGNGNNASMQITHDINGTPTSQSSAEMSFFNDEYKQIVVQRTVDVSGDSTIEVYTQEPGNERVANSIYTSLNVPVGSSVWHHGTELEIGSNFVGNVDDFRLWTVPLSGSRIDNHTLMPDGIDGNHVSASTEDLLFRMDFEYPKDRSSGGDTEIKNVSINIEYNELSGSAQGFPSVTEYPYQYIPYQRTVTANVPTTGISFSNKIRFDTQTSETNLKHNVYTGATSNDNVDDSNKLGLFFSPMKEINMDILRSLGQFNIDNYIGDPSDVYSDRYNDLEELRDYYFSRFNLNIYEYIQLVRYIDQTLFTTLESLVPARAKVSSGLLIEPHLLERSKVKHTKPIGVNIGEETTIDVDSITNQSAEYETKDAVLDVQDDIILSAESPIYDSAIDVEESTELNATSPFYDSLIDIDDTFEMSGVYGNLYAYIDATYTGSIQGEYESSRLISIGFDPDSISSRGFGIVGVDGHTIRTYIDVFGNRIQERNKVYRIKESRTVITPENIDPHDPTVGINYVPVTHYDNKVTLLNFTDPMPTVGGNIVEVEALNGYYPSHYRRTGDLTTGLQNSFFNGSKQTSLTTLDGGSPVQTFTTNPNTLRVNDTGRGSGTPILQID